MWQRILVLQYQDGKSITAIAELLQCSRSTISVYSHKGMHRLRSALNPFYQALLK